MTTTKTRSYSELKQIDTFEDRFRYLKLGGGVGVATFGYDRWLNQQFYTSRAWKLAREFVIVRDEGCDLGIEGYEIHKQLYVHHMNPLTPDQLMNDEENSLDPDFLITTTHRTHNAIHFGDESLLVKPFVERRPGDTRLW